MKSNRSQSLSVSEWKCAKCGTWNNEYRTECKQPECKGNRAGAEKWRVHYKSGVTIDL